MGLIGVPDVVIPLDNFRTVHGPVDLPDGIRRPFCYIHPARRCPLCPGMMAVDLTFDSMVLICEHCDFFRRVLEFGRIGLEGDDDWIARTYPVLPILPSGDDLFDRLPWRLQDKIDIQPNGCWYWTAQTSGGYGLAWWKGHTVMADKLICRLVYATPISDTLYLDHSCDHPECVNPRCQVMHRASSGHRKTMYVEGRPELGV